MAAVLLQGKEVVRKQGDSAPFLREMVECAHGSLVPLRCGFFKPLTSLVEIFSHMFAVQVTDCQIVLRPGVPASGTLAP